MRDRPGGVSAGDLRADAVRAHRDRADGPGGRLHDPRAPVVLGLLQGLAGRRESGVRPMTFTLTLKCPERSGIVHAVTTFLVGQGCDIVEHQQFDDDVRGSLFLRTSFTCTEETTVDDLTRAFTPVA